MGKVTKAQEKMLNAIKNGFQPDFQHTTTKALLARGLIEFYQNDHGCDRLRLTQTGIKRAA